MTDLIRRWTGTRGVIQNSNEQLGFGGLFVRRPAWRLTWRGWFLAIEVLLAAAIVFVVSIYSFLAPTERFPSDWLVVEGWMPRYSMKQVAAEFFEHHYKHAVLVCPIIDLDDKYESGRDAGENLTHLLEKYHMPGNDITVLYPPVVRKDRTYHSGLAAKDWIASQGPLPGAIDVITVGPHARRTRLLYEKAFGNGTKIGIIAAEDMQYDRKHWWRSSEGFRSVQDETIAYLYARLLFSFGVR